MLGAKPDNLGSISGTHMVMERMDSHRLVSGYIFTSCAMAHVPMLPIHKMCVCVCACMYVCMRVSDLGDTVVSCHVVAGN